MKTKFKYCDHCGSPYKGNPCYWLTDRPPEIVSAGWDSPCSCDFDAEASYQRERQIGRRFFYGFVTVVLFTIGFIVYKLFN